jgi:hypothetical protein
MLHSHGRPCSIFAMSTANSRAIFVLNCVFISLLSNTGGMVGAMNLARPVGAINLARTMKYSHNSYSM